MIVLKAFLGFVLLLYSIHNFTAIGSVLVFVFVVNSLKCVFLSVCVCVCLCVCFLCECGCLPVCVCVFAHVHDSMCGYACMHAHVLMPLFRSLGSRTAAVDRIAEDDSEQGPRTASDDLPFPSSGS